VFKLKTLFICRLLIAENLYIEYSEYYDNRELMAMKKHCFSESVFIPKLVQRLPSTFSAFSMLAA